jgi:hypothetical protein
MYNKVLGQPITKEIKELMSEVQTIFPNKQFHISKLEDSITELGTSTVPNCIAFSDTTITDYIAIWIRTDLPIEEFNVVLAEELLHHKQAYEGFPEITCLRPIRPEISYNSRASEIYRFGLEICSIICDLDAHRQMKTIQINIEPLLATDLRNLRNSIDELNSSELNLKALKAGLAKFSFFPKYLLFWFDLFDLGFQEYISIWQAEIRPWFVKVMPDTMKIWNNLTDFIHSNPIANKESAEKALIITFESLLSGVPTLAPKKTSDKSIMPLKFNGS